MKKRIHIYYKAKEACKNSGYQIADHFEDMLGMVSIGSGAEREIDDPRTSRLLCPAKSGTRKIMNMNRILRYAICGRRTNSNFFLIREI